EDEETEGVDGEGEDEDQEDQSTEGEGGSSTEVEVATEDEVGNAKVDLGLPKATDSVSGTRVSSMSPSYVFVGRLSDESGLDYKHVEGGHSKESGVKDSTVRYAHLVLDGRSQPIPDTIMSCYLLNNRVGAREGIGGGSCRERCWY
ncbi:hypothetical protein U1Q18_043724, partial [Sarracenia purpurea var. burkii]